MSEDRIIIVGAGIVGLACADFLAAEGRNVCVIDPDHEGDKASYGNAAGIAVTECIPASSPGVFWKVPGWLLDPLGPLALRWRHAPALTPWFLRFSQVSRTKEMHRIATALAALNDRTYDDLVPMLARNGLESELKRLGALTVYETDEAFEEDTWEWDLKRKHGIECRELSGAEARELEPALSAIVRRAVFTPQWSQVSEPRRLHNRILSNLREKGVQMLAGKAVAVQTQEASVTVLLQDGDSVTGSKAVIAAGAWSKPLAASLGDKVWTCHVFVPPPVLV
jgi:D-amino-acid dehydrogenase